MSTKAVALAPSYVKRMDELVRKHTKYDTLKEMCEHSITLKPATGASERTRLEIRQLRTAYELVTGKVPN